jgi:DNA-directed RNA polymerase beta' subunit
MEITFIPDEEVKRCSLFSVNERFDLYDERFGSIKATSKCSTCGKTERTGCFGHYGSLYLGTDIFHPIYYQELSEAINSLCQSCYKETHQPKRNTKSGVKCPHCGKTTYTDYHIPPSQSYLMKRRHSYQSLTPSQCRRILTAIHHPARRYLISYIIIPPTGIRPPEEVEWPSEVAKIYVRLVETVKGSSKVKGPKYTKKINDLYNAIVGLHRKDGVIKSFSGKEGIFRTLMLGKRLNRSARLVITGDPYLDLDEVLVPREVVQGIRIRERVWRGNLDLMKRWAREGRLWWDSEPVQAEEDHVVMGKVFDRELMDGDLILFNRQPSLSKYSLLAFRLRCRPPSSLPRDVLSFNPCVTPSFNADFDGDEMNIYAGYGLEARAELREICYVTKNIYDPLTRKVLIHPIQDVITGAYIATRWVEPISLSVYHQAQMRVMGQGRQTAQKVVTTLDLLSLSLPGHVQYQGEGVLIQNGTFMETTQPLTKRVLCHHLLLHLGENYGEEVLSRFIRDLQLVVLTWLDHQGFTLKLAHCVWRPEDEEAYHHLSRDVEKSTEKEREDLQRWVLQTSLTHYHHPGSTNPLSQMVRSGSKGTDIGAAQMAISVGQQYLGGNKKPTLHPESPSPLDHGFIRHGYVHGLSPQEYFSQASASLSGIVNIGTSVADIGYANRRVSKLTSDLTNNYNGVLSTPHQVVQFET